MNDLERLGGPEAVRGHIEAFVSRVFDDFIIGFQFANSDKQRVIEHETTFALRHLSGGRHGYSGRPLHQVHKPRRINRGQFRRRLAILRTVLGERGVPPDIIDRWVEHEQGMMNLVVDGTDCVPQADPSRKADPES